MIELTAGQIAKIVGGQLSGDSTVRVSAISTDSRTTGKSDVFVALKGERFDGNDFLGELDGRVGIAIAEKSEDVDYPIIKVENSLDALSELARFYCSNLISARLKVVLTGSVGKTTTKEMVSSVLSTTYKTAYTKGNFNNHIGVPLTILSVESDDEALVCEMGMNHKGELAHLTSLVNSDIAIITNIGHSHIENLGSREGIRDAKLEILGGLKKDGTLIINGDEPLLDDVDFGGKIIRVGLSERCQIWADDIEMGENELSYTLHYQGKSEKISLSCTGRHNVVNSLFAVAVGLETGMDIPTIQRGLLNYHSVGLRQKIYFKNGVRVIADCYNAGIESMTASLRLLSELSCKGRRIAVLSDMLELGDSSVSSHKSIGERAVEFGIDKVFTTGNFARLISEAAGDRAQHFETKEELASKLSSELAEGDTVLFKASRSMKLEEVISLADLEEN